MGWDLPSSQGPPVVRTRAEQFRSLNPLGTEGAEAKIWLSASNIGTEGGGGGSRRGGSPPSSYGRSNTSLGGGGGRVRGPHAGPRAFHACTSWYACAATFGSSHG